MTPPAPQGQASGGADRGIGGEKWGLKSAGFLDIFRGYCYLVLVSNCM